MTKTLIFLILLCSTVISCNKLECPTFEPKSIIGKYISEDYEGIEEILALESDYTFNYTYSSDEKVIVKIKGTYSLNKNEDPNGVVKLPININNLNENNFIDKEIYKAYKIDKSKVVKIYYFDNGQFNQFINPDKLVWSCGYWVRNYDDVGDFNRLPE